MFLRPGLITLNDKKYVVPGWKQVPLETTLISITEAWEKERPKTKLNDIKNFKIEGKPYVVTLIEKKLFCTCPAGTYRKKCKHAKLIASKIKDKYEIDI